MPGRPTPLLLAVILFAAGARAADLPKATARVPLDPAALAGAAVFTDAEQRVAAAAAAAGLAFVPDPRPLPPQVIQTFDLPTGEVRKHDGILFWRGEMLPDQLAPGETGTLVRKRLARDGTWKTVAKRKDFAMASATNLVAAPRAPLPATIIETPYRLGTVEAAPATLVLWRAVQEDSAPLGGFIVLPEADPAWLAALQASLPPFETAAEWAALFDALAP